MLCLLTSILPSPAPAPLPAASALGPRCLLLARKFSQPAAKWVHRLYRSCTADLGILPCSQELSDQDKVWWRR